MLMLMFGDADAVWIPSLWVLLTPGLLVVKCLVFRPSRVLMNIICLPSEERVLHAVSCALPPSHRSVQSSALLGGPGPSWSISVSNRITSALVGNFFHLDVVSSRVQSVTAFRSC